MSVYGNFKEIETSIKLYISCIMLIHEWQMYLDQYVQ